MNFEVSESAYIFHGLDVHPPVQEYLDGLEMASPSRPVECSETILSKKYKHVDE